MDITRRHFFSRSSTGIGIAALGSLLAQDGFAAAETNSTGGLPGLPHFAPKAKRVIFLHQSGGPSQMDLFDYKPTLDKLSGTELPGSVRMGQRITGMTSGQSALPGGALDLQVPAARASRARGSANCCRTPRRSSTNWRSSRR